MVKNPPANSGDAVSIPGLERSPGEGNGNLFQYSCLENPTDRGLSAIRVVSSAYLRLLIFLSSSLKARNFTSLPFMLEAVFLFHFLY